jgi:hypothetical protein
MASIPDSTTAGAERAQQHEQRRALHELVVLLELVDHRGVGDLAEVSRQELHEPHGEERAEDDHVEVGGDREELPRLLHPPQVAQAHERYEADGQTDSEVGVVVEVEGRADGEDAR